MRVQHIILQYVNIRNHSAIWFLLFDVIIVQPLLLSELAPRYCGDR